MRKRKLMQVSFVFCSVFTAGTVMGQFTPGYIGNSWCTTTTTPSCGNPDPPCARLNVGQSCVVCTGGQQDHYCMAANSGSCYAYQQLSCGQQKAGTCGTGGTGGTPTCTGLGAPGAACNMNICF